MASVRRIALLCLVAMILPAAGCKSPTLTVMTFNIRYDNPRDGVNAWPNRRAFVAEVIRKHDPDLLGLQEVLIKQRDQLLADLPGYESIGVGRDDGDRKGEFSPIFFRKARFTVVDKGWFWLSETPDRPGSLGWDAACARIATWARLRDATTKLELLILNTHFDHKGRKARVESAAQIAKFLEQQPDRTLIVTGDFNCGPDSDAHMRLMDQPRNRPLVDAFDRLVDDETDAGTFNGFEGVRTGPRIDWILHTNDLTPVACEIIRDSRDRRYPSDHFPVVTRFRMSRKN